MYRRKSVLTSVGSSKDLRVAVTFPKPNGGLGLTKYPFPITLSNVMEFVPKKQIMDQGIEELEKLGFELTGRGRLTVSMKCSLKTFKKVFNTKLKKKKIQIPNEKNNAIYFYYPPKGAGKRWKQKRSLNGLIEDVYIQWPHLYPCRIPFRKSHDKKTTWNKQGAPTPSAAPPKVKYHHLEVPHDLAFRLNATPLHEKGMQGEGIRVVMIDSGFEHGHPFFPYHRYTSKVILAGDAKDIKKDGFGHGTGQSANIFSVAPRVKFIGVKIGTDTFKDIKEIKPASLLEGFYKARRQNPDIISISGGHNLHYETSNKQRTHLPKSVKALEAEILHAVASGITVVVAAGNGEFSFPGMMPDVISAGGVFVDPKGNMRASDFASAFDSKIYPGRHVPDICGLAGMKPPRGSKPFDHYILLPVPAYSLIDASTIEYPDGTTAVDGWAPFSGTSAAAPQIAGVCALLKAKNPNLTPIEIKEILQKTAIKVLKGKSNPECSDDRKTPQKGAGATGAGLVDAFSAWQQV
jgi:hypothetical protein